MKVAGNSFVYCSVNDVRWRQGSRYKCVKRHRMAISLALNALKWHFSTGWGKKLLNGSLWIVKIISPRCCWRRCTITLGLLAWTIVHRSSTAPQRHLTAPHGDPGVSLTLCCFVVYSTRRLLYVLPCVILFLCFSVLLALRLPRLGKRELILVLFVRLFDLCLFGFVGFLFLLGSGKGCGLWLWHSLDFSLTLFF